jgi:hypothetical protein
MVTSFPDQALVDKSQWPEGWYQSEGNVIGMIPKINLRNINFKIDDIPLKPLERWGRLY